MSIYSMKLAGSAMDKSAAPGSPKPDFQENKMFHLIPNNSREIKSLEEVKEHINALIMATNAICVYAIERDMDHLCTPVSAAQAQLFKAEKALV